MERELDTDTGRKEVGSEGTRWVGEGGGGFGSGEDKRWSFRKEGKRKCDGKTLTK